MSKRTKAAARKRAMKSALTVSNLPPSQEINMSKPMSKSNAVNMSKSVGARKTLYALAAGTAIVILFGIYFSSQQTPPRPKPGYEGQPTAGQPAAVQIGGAGALVSTEPFFDFGKVSMAAGNVSHRYWIKKAGATPLALTNISTSCMCTEATLITQSARRKGPFGMPGHGPAVDIEERLAPGQVAQVEVVFDPAAHGPAGVGKIDRVVTIRNDAARPLELRFNALVTP